MIFLLRNFNQFNQGLQLNTISLELSGYPEKLTTQSKVNGWYVKLGNHIIGLYKSSTHQISILINNRTFVADPNLRIEFNANENESRLAIWHEDNCVLNVQYERPHPLSTLWYTEDAEDVDFGEWVYNLLNADDRRLIFLQSHP